MLSSFQHRPKTRSWVKPWHFLFNFNFSSHQLLFSCPHFMARLMGIFFCIIGLDWIILILFLFAVSKAVWRSINEAWEHGPSVIEYSATQVCVLLPRKKSFRLGARWDLIRNISLSSIILSRILHEALHNQDARFFTALQVIVNGTLICIFSLSLTKFCGRSCSFLLSRNQCWRVIRLNTG